LKEEKVTAALESRARDELKDPESAHMRNTVLYHHRFLEKNGHESPTGEYVLCGEINAKNAYGGYIGYARFISHSWFKSDSTPDMPSGVLFDDSDRRDVRKLFVQRYKEECRDTIE
jgi:hypothetical protein